MYGEQLRLLRKEKQLTMKELGEKFNLAESTISGYENETRKPNLDLILKFADFFDVSVDYILARSDSRRYRPTKVPLISNNIKQLSDPPKESEVNDPDERNKKGWIFLDGSTLYSEVELDIGSKAAYAAIKAYRKHLENKI